MLQKKIQQLLKGLTPKNDNGGGGGTALVAKQPIFDLSDRVRAFELLFRDPFLRPGLAGKSAHAATSTVIADGFDLMRPSLLPGQRFFINFTQELLEAELASVLPPDICVIEVLEEVPPTDSVLRGLMNLRRQGYLIALDDYVGQEDREPFMPLADIIKVEVLDKTKDDLVHMLRILQPHNVRLLAEKVEDRAMASLCRELGFTLFQGFFFSKAEVVRGKKLSPSQITKARLLAFSVKQEYDVDEMANIIKADVYLSYRLLKYVNSVYFGLTMEVRSVKHAIVMLGIQKLRQWLWITTLAEMDSTPMSQELVQISALRGKFLELLSQKSGPKGSAAWNTSSSLFLVGLFSLLDSMLNVPMQEVLTDLPMEEPVLDALGEGTGPYAPWLLLVKSYERGDWDAAKGLTDSLGISPEALAESYVEAAQWTTALYGSLVSQRDDKAIPFKRQQR